MMTMRNATKNTITDDDMAEVLEMHKAGEGGAETEQDTAASEFMKDAQERRKKRDDMAMPETAAAKPGWFGKLFGKS